MTTIIEMAREANGDAAWFHLYPDALKRFAALVRADEREVEREACAKVCEEQEYHYWRATEDQDFTPIDCANAIRARGLPPTQGGNHG